MMKKNSIYSLLISLVFGIGIVATGYATTVYCPKKVKCKDGYCHIVKSSGGWVFENQGQHDGTYSFLVATYTPKGSVCNSIERCQYYLDHDLVILKYYNSSLKPDHSSQSTWHKVGNLGSESCGTYADGTRETCGFIG